MYKIAKPCATLLLNKNKPTTPSLAPPPPRNEPHHLNDPTLFTAASSMLALALGSWLRSRRSRYLFVLLCFPILLPLLCAGFPFLCAAEVCIRIFRRRRRRKDQEEDRLKRCEEGCCGCEEICGEEGEEEVGLLQRYLEDQLMLVGSVYECDDSISGDADDSRVPLLS